MRAGTVVLVLALVASLLPVAASAHAPAEIAAVASRPHLIPPSPLTSGWPPHAVQGDPILPGIAQTTGTAKVVVLLVEFTDTPHDAARTPAAIDASMNDESPGAKTLRSYYKEVSFGGLTVQATIVSTWRSSARTMAYYGGDSPGGIDDANGDIYVLAAEAVRLFDPDVDFSAFDADGDGVVDHLVVLHAGGAQEEDPPATDLIWSHRWVVPDDPFLPGQQPLLADGVQIYPYIMAGESSPIGVVTHEFGHDLGLPDLYDTDGSSDGAGLWDLMAQGSWTGFPPGSSPAHVSAWSRIRLGWATDVVDVTASLVGTTVPAVETSGRIHRLGISGTLGREYFLVENRQPIGFDAALPGSGLLIWHVDDARADNDHDARRWVDLEEADEAQTGDRPTDAEDAWRSTALGWGPETTPNSRAYSGAATGWRVRDISASGDPMTATIAREVTRDAAVTEIRMPFQVGAGETVPATVVVRNEGATPEGVDVTVSVYRDRIDGSARVTSSSTALGPLAPQSSTLVNVSFPTTAAGRYLVHAAASLSGDEIPANDERVAHTLANRFFPLRDDVETGNAGWTLDGNPDDLHRWRIVNDTDDDGSSHSPTHAWRFGYVPTLLPNLFPPRWHTLTSPSVSVPGPPVHLILYQRYDLSGRTIDPLPINPSDSDRGRIEMSVDGGPWTLVHEVIGRNLSWRGSSVDLSSLIAGPSTIRMRFNASADVMPKAGGWWIDDIALAEGGLGYAVVLLGDPGPHAAVAGRTVRFDVKAANVGEIEDAFEFRVDPPAPGWRIRLETNGALLDLDGRTIRIAPDQDAALRVVVDLPAGTPAGTHIGQIIARSSTDPSASAGFPFQVVVGGGSPYESPVLWAIVGGVAAAAVAAGVIAARRRRRRVPPT